MNSTGNRIKKIRLSKGMTQSKFAESINKKEQTNKISKGTINNWEHDRNLPNKERLKIIAKIGQTSIFYLLNGDVEEDNKIDNRIEMNKNIEKSNIRLTNIINNRQKELKISSEELAKKTKTSVSTLYRHKKKGFAYTKIGYLEDIMQVLNISPRMIFGNLDHFESLEDFQKITVMLDYIKSFVDKSDLKTLECVYKYIKKLDKNKDK